jgi:tetratricopeptide (TPR) repeat protein
VDAGWNYVEKNPASAAEHFRKALAIRPSNADANYGYGYALLKLGRQEAATTHLCAARIGGVSIQREIAGLLAEHRLTCP